MDDQQQVSNPIPPPKKAEKGKLSGGKMNENKRKRLKKLKERIVILNTNVVGGRPRYF